MMEHNVLVSSIGGDVGQAVCKALIYSAHNIRILGTDCRSFLPHPIFCDSFNIVPEAGGTSYTDSMLRLIKDNSIEMLYICSEQELYYICDHYNELPEDLSSRIAIPPINIIDTCRNKYKTVEFLKANGLPYPHTIIYDQSVPLKEMLQAFNYPLVVKKISGCGSRSLHIIEGIKDFDGINDLDNTYMLQEYIPGTEYTNAVYRDSFSSEIYVISLERTLKNGLSNEVKVVADEEIQKLCKEIAVKLKLTGSINIQLRKTADGRPVIFEINPRYSSTSFMRARFGFNDVFFAFENMVLKKSITPPRIKGGEACRYITEYYKFS